MAAKIDPNLTNANNIISYDGPNSGLDKLIPQDGTEGLSKVAVNPFVRDYAVANPEAIVIEVLDSKVPALGKALWMRLNNKSLNESVNSENGNANNNNATTPASSGNSNTSATNPGSTTPENPQKLKDDSGIGATVNNALDGAKRFLGLSPPVTTPNTAPVNKNGGSSPTPNQSFVQVRVVATNAQSMVVTHPTDIASSSKSVYDKIATGLSIYAFSEDRDIIAEQLKVGDRVRISFIPGSTSEAIIEKIIGRAEIITSKETKPSDAHSDNSKSGSQLGKQPAYDKNFKYNYSDPIALDPNVGVGTYNGSVEDIWMFVTKKVIYKLEGGYWNPAYTGYPDPMYNKSGETMFGIDRKAGNTEVSAGEIGKKFWSRIDQLKAQSFPPDGKRYDASKKQWYLYYIPPEPIRAELTDLAAKVMKVYFDKNVKQYCSPELRKRILSNKRLLFHFSYACWNGPGYFQNFAKALEPAVEQNKSDVELIKLAVESRNKKFGTNSWSKQNLKVVNIMLNDPELS
jgi:hypothetical protein